MRATGGGKGEPATKVSSTSKHGAGRRWAPDLLGVVWVLAAAVAVLGSALLHGAFLGPFDQLSQYGLSKEPGVVVHNTITLDQIQQFIPWTTLAWTQVHQGHLPLWNPYSALGMPLAFNWQSATFSVPALVGYLVPVRLAYTVQVIVTLIVCGTGVYVLGPCAAPGCVGVYVCCDYVRAERSGHGLAGLAAVRDACVGGVRIFAAALLLVRGGPRARHIVFFSVVTVCIIYEGSPEADIILGLALGVFLVVLLGLRAFGSVNPGPSCAPWWTWCWHR